MSGRRVGQGQTVPDLSVRQSGSATKSDKASKTAVPARHPVGTGAATNPTDVIDTSPAADNFLNALNAQASLGDPEQEKEFDEKQLKAAEKQLQLLKILGIGLSPEEFAKETTALAKQIAGIAKDHAANSGGAAATSSETASPAATDAATTVAQTATAATSTAAPAPQGAAGNAAPPQNAGSTAPSSSVPAPGAGSPPPDGARAGATGVPAAGAASGTTGTDATDTGETDTRDAASPAGPDPLVASDTGAAPASTPDSFYSEVQGIFKELKKLETQALSRLNLSPDKKKKDEAKKLGREFNDAVYSTQQSAEAAGAAPAVSFGIAADSIDLSKVAFSLTA